MKRLLLTTALITGTLLAANQASAADVTVIYSTKDVNRHHHHHGKYRHYGVEKKSPLRIQHQFRGNHYGQWHYFHGLRVMPHMNRDHHPHDRFRHDDHRRDHHWDNRHDRRDFSRDRHDDKRHDGRHHDDGHRSRDRHGERDAGRHH